MVAQLTSTRHLAVISADDDWGSRRATVEERCRAIPRATDQRPGRYPDRRGWDTGLLTTGDRWELPPVEVEVHHAARFEELAVRQADAG